MEREEVSARALNICTELSQILNTGLDKTELEIVIKLVQAGEHPEAVAQVVRHLKQRAAELSKPKGLSDQLKAPSFRNM
ncbi:hypothetical protein WJX73_003272 [Symbiochloris irregularis]|uniref:Mitotic-spindle organizing protein 1 n=1 Tax=Symbiochloris irregularis TaxID=706552 RepID=A0AAW1P7L7_9CHLO